MKTSYIRLVLFPAVTAVLSAAMLAGCGGQGTFSPRAESAAVSVSISPKNQTAEYPSSLQFSATVTGASNQAVNWSIVGNTGTQGTISSGGLYTPGPNSGGNVTIEAQSQADLSATAETVVDVLLG